MRYSRRETTRGIQAMILVTALFAAACGGDDDDTPDETTSTTASTTVPVVEATTSITIDCETPAELVFTANGGDTVEVSVTGPVDDTTNGDETAILPVTGEPGRYAATATASGNVALSWEVTSGDCAEHDPNAPTTTADHGEEAHDDTTSVAGSTITDEAWRTGEWVSGIPIQSDDGTPPDPDAIVAFMEGARGELTIPHFWSNTWILVKDDPFLTESFLTYMPLASDLPADRARQVYEQGVSWLHAYYLNEGRENHPMFERLPVSYYEDAELRIFGGGAATPDQTHTEYEGKPVVEAGIVYEVEVPGVRFIEERTLWRLYMDPDTLEVLGAW